MTKSRSAERDVVVVGAGFAGLYLIHKLRGLGFDVRCYDQADDVGGTWYWNRYPGARCDIPTTDYTYSFDEELEQAWSWSEKYATQPEILDYLGFVADRYDLRRSIEFGTRVDSAAWDGAAKLWRLRTSAGHDVACRFYVMASGCLSLPKTPDIEGVDRFTREVYFTGKWPHEPVDFTGKRVAVIGTGSSAVQAIPLIAEHAESLTVFQRTAAYSIPARNGPASAERLAQLEKDRAAYRDAARWSPGGIPGEYEEHYASLMTPQQQRERFEQRYAEGELFAILGVFNDQGARLAANNVVSELLREKIRERVTDPAVAAALCPKDYPFGTKRPCLDTGYYETFNLPHVRLIDVRDTPIVSVTETGIDTSAESLEFDAIVYATGFDAMTGPLVSVDITGRDGVTLRQKWADGPSTYLGLTTSGFPNFFTITGPGSPSVLSNMAVSIEQHVEWVADCLAWLREEGYETIEATAPAEAGWNQHVADCAALTLTDLANSWYVGANVPGKPRLLYPYVGGVEAYRAACDEVTARRYLGFKLSGPRGTECNEGVVRRVQPDVAIVLNILEASGLPGLETLSAADARGLMTVLQATRLPGPEVGEVVDGTLRGATGPLPYRLYRPGLPGPHPVLVYFHGGGWVLGDLDSDDPLCRDLCDRTGAVVVSVNYRHAPEDRFPAAADDAFAAVEWVAAHASDLGGIPGQVLVAGWSAGGNIAAVACQKARDAGGPALIGQVLISPVTDSDLTRSSYVENAAVDLLTTAVMGWFWDQYADPADRTWAVAAPLRGDLRGLPPAVIVTADFDPLRDEGIAYAQALEAAGVAVRHVVARGHTHTSTTMVDVVLSGAPVRAELAEHVRAWFRGDS
ncbi:MAG TPA: alpha/beta hydrolase fold domain-containing protein [Mycobacteriales bacterium]|nr:alpha/beta hydrolase fold domain-containing protein [Mycobacteriales bacterium]